MKKNLKNKLKKGLASIYVVIFSSLLFGVITLSFVRLIISDSFRTINDDLSQSAYDAALAGIEDAKKAILNGEYGWDECNDFAGNNKQPVYLGSTSTAKETVDQAYTCVKAKGELEDYRTTLNPNDRTRVIDLPDGTSRITIQWYSVQNASSSKNNIAKMMEDGFEKKTSGFYAPPIITAQLIGEEDSSTVVLYPASSGGNGVYNMEERASETKQQSKQNIYCNVGEDYACKVDIEISNFDDYLVITLPYGEEDTDFLIDAGQPFQFVQYEIDSTGRANNVYRRVMARVEVIDPNFAIPEYGIYTLGGFEKNFWVTYNNWGGPNSGNVDGSPYVVR